MSQLFCQNRFRVAIANKGCAKALVGIPVRRATETESHPPSLQCTFGPEINLQPMNPVLQRLEAELARSLRGLTGIETQVYPHHNPDRWNICQIVQHLQLSYTATISSLEERVAKKRPTRSRATPSQLLARFFVLGLGVIPVRREAPEITIPPAQASKPLPTGDMLISSISQMLNNLDKAFDNAEGYFHSSPCLSHFALGPLSIPQWRRFHLVHGRHHIRQIIAIRHEYRL